MIRMQAGEDIKAGQLVYVSKKDGLLYAADIGEQKDTKLRPEILTEPELKGNHNE